MLYTRPYLTTLHDDEYAVLMIEYYVSAKGYTSTFDEPGAGDEIEVTKIYKQEGDVPDSWLTGKIPSDIRMIEYEEIETTDYDNAIETAEDYHANKRITPWDH